MNHKNTSFRVGHVAIVGRANVGKSTLLNHLIGQKISITTRKPQTTRHHILGISTTDRAQIIYIDTPGIQQAPKSAMNRYMNRQALNMLEYADVILFVVEASQWFEQDDEILKLIRQSSSTIIMVINKVDKIDKKDDLLPFLEQLKENVTNDLIVPISALSQDDTQRLESILIDYLPPGEPIYKSDQVTDRSVRFMAAEIIREKLIKRLGDELPYQTTVTIESFKEKQKLTEISAIIWVERKGQKAIVIGKQGTLIKTIGEQARIDIESLLDKKVFIELWVKQKDRWTDDEKALNQFNYDV